MDLKTQEAHRQTPVLAGQRALVTGANAGLGAEIAQALAGAGAKVVVHYTHGPEQAKHVVKGIKAEGGEAMAIDADVRQEDQVKAMFERMYQAYGSIDILVNNGALDKHMPLVDMTLDDWEDILRVNLTGQFLCASQAAREFLRRGVVPELSCSAGKIICLSSVHDIIPWAGHAPYAVSKVSKAGALMLMKTMALELAAHKVRVNGISPGAVKIPTNRMSWETPEKEAELLELIPYGRVGHVSDVARTVVWIASDDSDYVTGTTIYVDGGMTLYPGFHDGG